MPSSNIRSLWSLCCLAWVLLLCGCGQDARALNSQGERALRYRAFVDAQYFFQYAQERIDSDLARGRVTGPSHPEQPRTRVGRLALTAWIDAPEFLTSLRKCLLEQPEELSAEDLARLADLVLEARLAPEADLVLQLAAQRGLEASELAKRAAPIQAAAAQALAEAPGWAPPGPEAFLAGADFGRRSWPTQPPEFAPGVDPKTFR